MPLVHRVGMNFARRYETRQPLGLPKLDDGMGALITGWTSKSRSSASACDIQLAAVGESVGNPQADVALEEDDTGTRKGGPVT